MASVMYFSLRSSYSYLWNLGHFDPARTFFWEGDFEKYFSSCSFSKLGAGGAGLRWVGVFGLAATFLLIALWLPRVNHCC